jgi:hypothetical protein
MNKTTILSIIFVLAATLSLRAQNAADYAFTYGNLAYVPLTGATAATAVQGDDQSAPSIPIGFNFYFCGVPYTNVRVCSNGWISFNTSSGSNSLTNSAAEAGNITNIIMPLWDDLDGGGSVGTASYTLTGTAPNRVFTFEWKGWQWNYQANAAVISFQVQLFETTNIIQFNYSQDPANIFNGFNTGATIGIARNDADFLVLDNSSAAPTVNTTTFIDNILSKPATGQYYRFKPSPPRPNFTIVKNPLCVGETIDMTATTPIPGGVLLWKGPGGFSRSNVSNVTIPMAQTTHTGIYSVRVAVGTDTSLPSDIFVNVYPIPAAPIVPSSLVSYCLFDQASPLYAIGSNLLWYNAPVGGVGSATTPTVNTSVADTVLYFVSQTVNGCQSLRSLITGTVSPKPPVPLAQPITIYCENDVATALTAVGQNLRWYDVPTGGVGAVIAPVPNTTAPDTITWYVSQTVAGCEGPRARMDIVVAKRPNALIQSSKPWICQYDTLTVRYFGSADNITSYQWGFPDGAEPLTGSPQGPITLRFNEPGRQRITLTVAIGGCVSAVEEHFVDIRPEPNVQTAVKPDVCVGEELKVGLTYEGTSTIDKYNWDFGGGQILYGRYDKGPFGIKFNQPGEHYITVVGIDDACASRAHIDTITVHTPPDAAIEGYSGQSLCAGDSLMLNARTISSGYQYQWAPAHFFDEYSNLPATYVRMDITAYVSLTVTDMYGCENTDSVKINAPPCCQVVMPNAFTPNGDGRNDVFRMINNGRQSIKAFRVASRWGQTVFETGDDRRGWDGNMNGQPQPMGTYYYYLQFICNGATVEQSGEVTLIR